MPMGIRLMIKIKNYYLKYVERNLIELSLGN
jgi:hypothetical protein